MTRSYAACGTIDHQVLGQDTGEISPGKGEGWGREVGYLGGGGGNGRSSGIRDGRRRFVGRIQV